MQGIFRYLLSAAAVVGLSVFIIYGMTPAFYSQWAGFLSICTIPTLVMLNIFVNAPLKAGGRQWPQPAKGLLMLGGAIISGIIFAPLILFIFQGGIKTPSIVTMMFVIFSVVTMMWLSQVFEGWPARSFTGRRWVEGLITLVLAYVSAYLLFPLLFDFSAFGLPPTGLFPAWPIIVFTITTLGVIFIFALMEQMPLKAFRHLPQPFSGLITGFPVLLLSGIFMWLVTAWGGVDVVSFMVAGPISFLFGVFMVNDVSEGKAFAGFAPPARGVLRIIASAAMALLMYWLYWRVMAWIAPGQPAGGPRYMAELWLANAMLSVTFPVILIYAHFFDGWPLSGLPVGALAQLKKA